MMTGQHKDYPMTEKRYFFSDALEAESSVTGCTPQEDGRYRVTLSATLFHPQGGGQPSDKGTIGQANMLQAVQEAGEIIHITDAPLDIGPVTLKVDGNLRQLHTRYHSAGHLIAVAGEKYGWQGIKGDHRPGEGRIVFEPGQQTIAVTAEDFARQVADLVSQALPRHQREEQSRRMITWGDLPAYACGGTHVSQTSEVGEVLITRVREKKGQLSVQYEVSKP